MFGDWRNVLRLVCASGLALSTMACAPEDNLEKSQREAAFRGDVWKNLKQQANFRPERGCGTDSGNSVITAQISSGGGFNKRAYIVLTASNQINDIFSVNPDRYKTYLADVMTFEQTQGSQYQISSRRQVQAWDFLEGLKYVPNVLSLMGMPDLQQVKTGSRDLQLSAKGTVPANDPIMEFSDQRAIFKVSPVSDHRSVLSGFCSEIGQLKSFYTLANIMTTGKVAEPSTARVLKAKSVFEIDIENASPSAARGKGPMIRGEIILSLQSDGRFEILLHDFNYVGPNGASVQMPRPPLIAGLPLQGTARLSGSETLSLQTYGKLTKVTSSGTVQLTLNESLPVVLKDNAEILSLKAQGSILLQTDTATKHIVQGIRERASSAYNNRQDITGVGISAPGI